VARGYRQLIAELQDEQKRLKQTPIRPLPLHAARHTFASQAFAEMMDPSWVSRQLGHHSVAFTLDTYVHLLPGRRDFAAVEFGDSSHRPDTPGHKSDTGTQNRAKRDPETLH
jgi:integrase